MTPMGSRRNRIKEGGKGVNIAGQDYALWFSREGFRIAPGRSAFGPGSTLVPWVKAAAMVSNLLRDGMFATQDRIDAARDNEFRELASTLWDLRRDFNERAENSGELPSIKEAFRIPGFPDSSARMKELLKDSETRQNICAELWNFAERDSKLLPLLRFKHSPDPYDLYHRIDDMNRPIKQFQAVDGFAPVTGKFVTEDEIDRMITGGPHVSESKLQIYAYFVQGHNAKECADLLKRSYGDGGYCYTGYDEWHDSKGIRLSRSDDFSKGKYDTATLNWNQVQKRVRALIDSGRYLNKQERLYLPRYEKLQLARKIYAFQYYNPNDPNRTYPHEWDFEAPERDILPLLNDPEKSAALYGDMVKTLAAVPLDDRAYAKMEPALQDMGAFIRGEYSLFAPLPETVLQAERQQKQVAKEKKKEQTYIKRESIHTISEVPEVSDGELSAAARALAQKMQPNVRESEDGQLSFDLFGTPPQSAEPPSRPPTLSPESAAPVPSPETATPSKEPEEIDDSRSPWWDAYKEIKEANPDNIVLYQIGDFFEMYGEDAKTAAAMLDLNLNTRPIAGVGRVERCGVPAHLLAQYVERLRDRHDVTIVSVETRIGEQQPYTLLSYDNEARQALDRHEAEYGADGTRVFRDTGKEAGPAEAPEIKAALGDKPTVRELYEHYKPIVKSLVLEDEAYKNACVNSDREAATFEGNEAVKRAALSLIDVTRFFRLYADNTAFHTRLHREVVEETYPMLSRFWQEHENSQDSDSILHDPEFMYRRLSILKSDCDYFLGAGQRYQKHLSEGGIEAQIAKMRELYDALPEKPEWLTAEDIDRYEAQMHTSVVTVTVPNYEATVTAEEAPLLARLLANSMIDTSQFVHDNGAVTFMFGQSDRDAVEKLITQLRMDISKAVASTYKTDTPKKPGRTRPELNYRTLARMFPEIISGEYRYLSMEAGDSMMPLNVEWIDTDVIAVSHTYTHNGDLMYDPEMTFRVDREKGTLEPLTFRQDGSLPIYQEVYPEPGKWIPKLSRDLSRFAQQWLQNISQQQYHKKEAIVERDGEDVSLTFDQDGNVLEPAPDVLPQPDTKAPVSADYQRAYSRLNALKEDCEYFLGSEWRIEKNLFEGSIAAQIAKMRELYEAVPEKPEWLTAEDIDRYEHRMTALINGREWPVSPAPLYRNALDWIDREIKRGGWVYEQLRDRSTDYDSAKEALENGLYGYLKHVAFDDSDMMVAYHTLPKFREWLIEDLLERNYQDVAIDPRDALERYADSPDVPEWAKGAPPAPEQPEHADATPAEPDLTPNVEQYLNLKAQYPDRLIGVQVGGYMLFYGKDAEEAASALGTNLVTREIDGLGETAVHRSACAWTMTRPV